MFFWNVTSCNLLRIYRRSEDTFFLVYKTHIAVNQKTVFLTFTAMRTLYMYVIQEIPFLACTEQMLVGLGTDRLLLSRCVLEGLS